MNQLQFEKSPYLLQHAGNPVHWRPWGPEAFQAARTGDKPVLLSVGYSTCHWCHVMAKESFEDADVAQVLNRDFISIKVDREERPDVDAAYMAACVAMNGSGGWPLTVLLTPDQKPFWAGTYLPKRQFLSLLAQSAQLWQGDRARLMAAGAEITAHLKREEAHRPGVPERALVYQAAALYAQSFDPRWGGFGAPPKFPTPHNLIFLLRHGRIAGDDQSREMAEETLRAMYRGGLFDHVGGGFSRYSTDEKWLAPHFEKMLYDNALLALAYTEAFLHTHNPLYEAVARRTLDYASRELRDPLGGYYCGQDADSEGEEGKFYLFTKVELESLLGPEDGAVFCAWYGVTQGGNFEGKNILNLLHDRDLTQEPAEIQTLREKVFRYRQSRVALHRDDKVLAAWNGLMIAALAQAGLALDEPKYLANAVQAADFLKQSLTDGSGRLCARWRQGERAHAGKLDDYAFCAWGLLELYAATFEVRHLAEALRLSELLLARFFDPVHGGFYPYASDGEQLITRTKEVYDGAMPSGNSVAALVLDRLARLTGELRWREAADLQLAYLAGAAEHYPAGYGFSMLAMLEALWPTAELVCCAREVPQELTAFLRADPRPEITVLLKTPETAAGLAALAPFTQAYPIPPQGALYYLCRGGACAQPTQRLSDLF